MIITKIVIDTKKLAAAVRKVERLLKPDVVRIVYNLGRDSLLEQAVHLARREPRRPRQTSLRRAVSTAYYALFHFLIAASVANWRITRHRCTLAREFTHTNMAKTCRQAKEDRYYADPKLPEALKLKSIAATFADMHEEREKADYDNSIEWNRPDVLFLIDKVRDAFTDWNAISHTEIAEDSLVSLLAKR